MNLRLYINKYTQTQVNRQTLHIDASLSTADQSFKTIGGPMYPSFTKCYVVFLEADNTCTCIKPSITNTNTYTIILWLKACTCRSIVRNHEKTLLVVVDADTQNTNVQNPRRVFKADDEPIYLWSTNLYFVQDKSREPQAEWWGTSYGINNEMGVWFRALLGSYRTCSWPESLPTHKTVFPRVSTLAILLIYHMRRRRIRTQEQQSRRRGK